MTLMFAANAAAVSDRSPRVSAGSIPLVERSSSLLHRARGLAAGILFLASRVPMYVALLLFGALVSLMGAVLYLIQAAGFRLTRPAGTAAAAVLALVCVGSPQRAKADMADTSLMTQTTLVSSQQTNLYSFDAPGAGTLSVTLKDWAFPMPLQELTASILSQDQVLGSWDSSKDTDWSFAVPISGSGLFDAFVAAQAGSSQPFQFGAYSMSISFQPAASPVPLPPAFGLLLGGIGLLGAMTLVERISRRRNRDVMSIA